MTSSIESAGGILPVSSRTKGAASEAVLFIFQLPTIRGLRTVLGRSPMALEKIVLSGAVG